MNNKVKDAQIIDFYRTAMNNREKPKLQDMAEQFGVTSDYLSKLLDACGLRTRTTRKREPKKARYRVCPECNTKADHHHARFCWQCGADMRPPVERAVDAFVAFTCDRIWTGEDGRLIDELRRSLEEMYYEVLK